MWEWFAKTPLGSAAKTAIAFVVAACVADWVAGGDISFSNWETWVIGAVASAVPPIINWLNPKFDSYGRTDVGGE